MNKKNKQTNLFSNIKPKKKPTPVVPPKEEVVIDPKQISFQSDESKEFMQEKTTFFQQTTKRNVQLATKLTQEDYDLINWIAYEKRWKLVEVLENSVRLMVQQIKKEKEKC